MKHYYTYYYLPSPPKPCGGSGTAGVDLIFDICISMKAVDFLKMSEKISNRIEVAMNKKEQELYMGVDHSVRHLGY